MLPSLIIAGRASIPVIVFVIATGNSLALERAQGSTNGKESIIPTNAQVKLLFDGADGFTEGPAVGLDGHVYFSDIINTATRGLRPGSIWKYSPRTNETSVFRSPSGMANGIVFDREGRMVVAEGADFGGRRVIRIDMTTGKSEILAGLYNGRPFNAPNDLAIDEAGRIYFTDPRYFGHEPIEQPTKGVYCIDLDGTVSLIITDAGKPNGILVSPDQKTLYVASVDDGALGTLPQGMRAFPGRQALLAYDLSDGDVAFRETLIDFSPQYGPDGMAIDVEGNLYLARPGQPGIYVYTPKGNQLGHIPTPRPATNAAFGCGETNKTLFITSGKSLYSIELNKEGYNLACR
jgi:gluconolactonase